MKKVVKDSEVAHLFANKLQDDARTPNGGLYFGKNYKNEYIIFSYGSHFPIAKHVTNDKGENALLFTTRTYSVTTSKHLSIVRSATSHLNRIYCNNPDASTDENLEAFTKEVESIFYEINTGNKREKTKIQLLSTIDYVREKVNIFCEFFSIDLEKAAPKLFEILKVNELTGITDYETKKAAINKAAAEKRLKDQKKKQKTELVKWRKFELPRLWMRIDTDYLRYNESNNRIETSQGIEIPLEIGKRFYKQVLAIVKSGNCTLCGTEFMNRYEIKDINKDFLVIGCHKITIKEIQNLATTLKW